jgi:hypothetical protein
MPPTPIVVMELDDSSGSDLPPFTTDVSMRSFADDFNLRTRTAAAVFRNLHQACGSSQFRGYPTCVARATFKLFDDFVEPTEVTWLTADELGHERSWLPHGDSHVERTLQLLFESVDVAARKLGANRVRLVFAFC